MRLTATSITIFTLFLASCTPQPGTDMKKELNALSGPNTGSIDDSLKGQADQAIAKHDYSNAAQTYRQLSDKEPGNKDYSLALADSLRRSGDNQNAESLLEKYLSQHPDDPAALEGLGLCQMNLGNFADAGKSFEKVMAIDPKRWRTLNAVGILFTIKNKPTEAIGYYDEALDNSKDNASILNNKALTLTATSRFDEAIEIFQNARKHLRVGSPELQHIDMDLALVYAIAGRLDDAEKTASVYLSKAALYNNMGVYADLAKNQELAKGYLNMALTQNPVYYERAWKNLGNISDEHTTEDYSKAKILKIDPTAEAESQSRIAPPLLAAPGNGETKLNQVPIPASE